MGQRVGIAEAARLMNLSQHELRRGCAAGIYPHFRVGASKKGKLIFDLDLLEKRLAELMQSNVQTNEQTYGKLRRII